MKVAIIIATDEQRERHRMRSHHHHRKRLAIFISTDGLDKVGAILIPEERIVLMDQVTVGHTDTIAIVQVDQNGNPMKTPVAFDAPPAWTNVPGSPPIDGLVVAADGSTAVATALAAGQDTITVTATVGGVTYTATLQLSISEAPQVLSGIKLVGTVA